jgi:hypothetical protein
MDQKNADRPLDSLIQKTTEMKNCAAKEPSAANAVL